jgi:hypothetical protein
LRSAALSFEQEVVRGNAGRCPVPQQQTETIMSKHEDKLKSPAMSEIKGSGALDDKDLEKVTGGDKASPKKVTGDIGVRENLSLSFSKFKSEYNAQG